MTWLNVIIWIWQVYSSILNVPRGILHTFFSEWAQTNIAGMSEDELTETAIHSMRIIGVSQGTRAIFEFLVLAIGTPSEQMLIFGMDVFSKSVGTIMSFIPGFGYPKSMEESTSAVGVDTPGLWIFLINLPIDWIAMALMVYGVYFD